MTILHVGSTLPNKEESERLQNAAYLSWFENGRLRHVLCRDGDTLRPDELSLQIRLAILQQHFDDLTQILLQLIKRFALRMRPRKSGNVADVKGCVRTALDDRGVGSHAKTIMRCDSESTLVLTGALHQRLGPARPQNLLFQKINENFRVFASPVLVEDW
jgi:hypothetical protein